MIKNLNYILFGFVLGMLALTSCESDRESNPTLQTPTEFVLNTPAYVDGVYDLSSANSVLLTCSQPNYGFAAGTTYAVEVATDANFAKSAVLPTTFTSARMEVPAKEIAVAIVPLLGIDYAENFPTGTFPLYFRLKASIPNTTADYNIVSNAVTLPKVKSYFALEPLVLPDNLYMVGDFNSFNWANSVSLTQVHADNDKTKPNRFWAMVWCEQGKGLLFNSVNKSDDNQFGVNENVTVSGLAYTTDVNKRLISSETGWRLMLVTVTIQGRVFKYDINFMEPNIYIFGPANGGTWAPAPAWKFSVPTTATGEFVSPPLAVTTSGGNDNLRMTVVFPDTDWWKSEFIILNRKIVYRGNGNDQDRIGATAGQRVYLNFSTGAGRIE